jgi:aspartate racemase
VHIGLIGGIGPAATEFYYRGLVARHAGSAKPMELTIVHADVRELSRNAAVGDAQKQAQIFLKLVRRLASAGTDLFLAFDGRACGFPVADCAEIHMDALHRASVGEQDRV